jgi:hypothetical protein
MIHGWNETCRVHALVDVEITVFKMMLRLVSLRLDAQSDTTSMLSNVAANTAERNTEISACLQAQKNQ